MNDLEDTVRAELTAYVDRRLPTHGLAAAPLLRMHRRRSRVRRVAGAATVAVAMGGAALAVAVHPTAGRSAPAPAAPTPSRRVVVVAHGPADRPLDIGRVRGSLAADAGFLAALQAHVLASPLEDNSGRRITLTSKDVTVYYAGDQGGRRRALVQVAGRSKAFAGLYTVWFRGPAGAAARQLRQDEGAGFAKAPVDFSLSFDGTGTSLLYLTSGAEPLLVAGPPTYAADGTTHRAVREVYPTADGVIDLTLKPSELCAFPTLGQDPAVRHWQAFLPLQTSLPTGAVDRALPFVHAGSAFPSGPLYQADTVAGELTRMQASSGLPADATPRRFLWGGSLGTAGGYAVVLTAPSGANLVFVTEGQTRPGGGEVFRQVRTVLPAGPLERIAVAWARIQPGRHEPDPDHPQVVAVGVIGPVGAARARLTDRTGQVVETALTNGGGSLTLRTPDSQASTVQFLADDGSVLATSKVLPLNADINDGVPLPS